MKRAWWLALAVLFLVLGQALQPSTPGEAHGKEVRISVTSLMPDPDQPLRRLYRAEVSFEDGDPVEEANLALRAVREEGGSTVGPVPMAPLGEPGIYVAEVVYDRFGVWTVRVSVTHPGEGEAEFRDEILPRPQASDSDSPPAPVPEDLAILFRFDLGDVVNIVMRFVHSLAGAAWFGLVGAVLVGQWFLDPSARVRLWARLQRFFPRLPVAALLILLLSGVYNGIWDAPIRPPGVFDVATMLRAPFGEVYMAAFLGKVLAYAVLVAVTLNLNRALLVVAEAEDEQAARQVGRLAAIGMGIAVFIAVDVAVLVYVHYISHLSVFLPLP